MITVKEFQNKTFESKEDLFRELKANKSKLIASKMATTKQADAICHSFASNSTTKASAESVNELVVKFVVNSCGWLDSHNDVHVKGCWNKTASEQGRFLHLQEHKAQFDSIISEDVTKSVEEVNIQGHFVDALVATSKLSIEDNPKMFKRYAKGQVKEHSVGMMYVKGKLYLCINSEHEDYAEEKQMWDKYRPQVINGEQADEKGYFWAVAEAKAIEGSAVVFGSNSQTPTISVTEVKNEPLDNTQKQIEPTTVTQSELGNFYKTLLN